MNGANGNGRNGAAAVGMPPTLPTAMMADRVPVTSATMLPEAPAAVNWRMVYRGVECQFTLRDVDGRSVVARLDAMLAALAEAGAESVGRAGASHTTRPSAPPTQATADDDLEFPMCPTHGTPMRPGNRGGWYCPRKLANDDGTGKPVYCRQRVNGNGGGR